MGRDDSGSSESCSSLNRVGTGLGAEGMFLMSRRGLEPHLSAVCIPPRCLVLTHSDMAHPGEASSNLFKSCSVPQAKPRETPETPWPCRARGHPCSSSETIKAPAYTSFAFGRSTYIYFFLSSPLVFFFLFNNLAFCFSRGVKTSA